MLYTDIDIYRLKLWGVERNGFIAIVAVFLKTGRLDMVSWFKNLRQAINLSVTGSRRLNPSDSSGEYRRFAL